ncbi:hypothetical protein K438DRAFT_776080 [Mycena galopus ATCC 62051]|nr:hypothetical protein K438DRAFT_776080 [Mycena galopus ATCC 62051]
MASDLRHRTGHLPSCTSSSAIVYDQQHGPSPPPDDLPLCRRASLTPLVAPYSRHLRRPRCSVAYDMHSVEQRSHSTACRQCARCALRHGTGAIPSVTLYDVHTAPRTQPRPSSTISCTRRATPRFLVAHAASLCTATLFNSSEFTLEAPCAPSAAEGSRSVPVHARALSHLQHDTDHPRRTHHTRQLLPIAPSASITSPRIRHLTALCSTLAFVPHRE